MFVMLVLHQSKIVIHSDKVSMLKMSVFESFLQWLIYLNETCNDDNFIII